MITGTEILKAGNRILKETFPNIPRESHDVAEGFTRECFFVELDGSEMSYQSETVTSESAILRVHYFPTNEYINISELMSMQNQLGMAYGLKLKVNDDFYIPIGNITFAISDNKVLTMDMELTWMQLLPEDEDLEDMENLEYNT